MVLCRTANRSLGLFLRPPITLAKTHQRAHQRHAPPLAAQKHQPQHRPNTPLHHRGQPQPHATTTTQLAQPPRPLQSTKEHPPLELAVLTKVADSVAGRFTPSLLPGFIRFCREQFVSYQCHYQHRGVTTWSFLGQHGTTKERQMPCIQGIQGQHGSYWDSMDL